VTAPCDTVSFEMKRSLLNSSASGRSPSSDSMDTSLFATMLAMRLPRPMSVSSSARVRLPVKRSSFSHSG